MEGQGKQATQGRQGRGKGKGKVDERFFDGFEAINLDAAGIDVGSQTHYVSVPDDRDEKPVRSFGCYTADLLTMAAWLKQCKIRTVVMESTGVYWIPVYRVLEDAGFDVQLVDARHAKSVPGRKTDVWDSRWLRRLHTFGLLRGCFIPARDIQTVRTYWRHRLGLVESASQQIHLMQKSLEQMNVQLHKVISDITGVTGTIIIRAIVAGERDPEALASLEHPKVKRSKEEIIKALTGHYSEEHLFTLQQALETYDFCHQQMVACDAKVQAYMAQFEDKQKDEEEESAGEDAANTKKSGQHSRRKNEPHFDLRGELFRITGIDLPKAHGIQAMTAQVVYTELGYDVSDFPTVKHFCSWLCVCPNNRTTGGRIRSRRTRRTQNRLANALRVAVQSLHSSDCALGAFYRKIKAKRGPAVATTATAHKLARIIYHMLKHGEAFVEQGQAEREAKYREQQIKRLQKNATKLGFTLVNQETGEMAGAPVPIAMHLDPASLVAAQPVLAA